MDNIVLINDTDICFHHVGAGPPKLKYVKNKKYLNFIN